MMMDTNDLNTETGAFSSDVAAQASAETRSLEFSAAVQNSALSFDLESGNIVLFPQSSNEQEPVALDEDYQIRILFTLIEEPVPMTAAEVERASGVTDRMQLIQTLNGMFDKLGIFDNSKQPYYASRIYFLDETTRSNLTEILNDSTRRKILDSLE